MEIMPILKLKVLLIFLCVINIILLECSIVVVDTISKRLFKEALIAFCQLSQLLLSFISITNITLVIIY